MNEVKEMVEELRNKKSRDNRELLDKSANMIEKLAKELCEKSGCHHKCHSTEDCVVEDEALLLINENKSNNFGVKSNKQIEEMVMELAEAHHKMDVAWTNYFCDCEKFPKPKTEHLILAEHLYNAGYRKQEWISVEDRLPDKYELVLIFVEGEIRLDYIDGYDTWHENFLYRVTHWMPLPEAPKMKGGGE